jgi:hypothetical protein
MVWFAPCGGFRGAPGRWRFRPPDFAPDHLPLFPVKAVGLHTIIVYFRRVFRVYRIDLFGNAVFVVILHELPDCQGTERRQGHPQLDCLPLSKFGVSRQIEPEEILSQTTRTDTKSAILRQPVGTQGISQKSPAGELEQWNAKSVPHPGFFRRGRKKCAQISPSPLQAPVHCI